MDDDRPVILCIFFAYVGKMKYPQIQPWKPAYVYIIASKSHLYIRVYPAQQKFTKKVSIYERIKLRKKRKKLLLRKNVIKVKK